MRTLLKRWYFWHCLLLLLGVAGSVALIHSSQSRINQEKFDLIQDGMRENEVAEILGEPDSTASGSCVEIHIWRNGPNWIKVYFMRGANDKDIHLATAWESLQWYAKKGAAKIGVKWD